LSNSELQAYVELTRDFDYVNRGVYNLKEGLYIGRRGLGLIDTKFGKVITCFEIGGLILIENL
jgi:hypothetical protein